MKASRLFVTDNSCVTICNGRDDSWVIFENAEDFKRITGEDLPHNDYIVYQPDDEFFHDDHYDPPSDTWAMLPFYENLINNCYVYLQRMQDPTYGKTPAQIAEDKLMDSKGKLQNVVYSLIENDGRAKLKKLKTMPQSAADQMTNYAAQLEQYISVLAQSLSAPVAADTPIGYDEASDEPIEPIINPVATIIPVTEAINLAEPVWPFSTEPGDTSLWW